MRCCSIAAAHLVLRPKPASLPPPFGASSSNGSQPHLSCAPALALARTRPAAAPNVLQPPCCPLGQHLPCGSTKHGTSSLLPWRCTQDAAGARLPHPLPHPPCCCPGTTFPLEQLEISCTPPWRVPARALAQLPSCSRAEAAVLPSASPSWCSGKTLAASAASDLQHPPWYAPAGTLGPLQPAGGAPLLPGLLPAWPLRLPAAAAAGSAGGRARQRGRGARRSRQMRQTRACRRSLRGAQTEHAGGSPVKGAASGGPHDEGCIRRSMTHCCVRRSTMRELQRAQGSL